MHADFLERQALGLEAQFPINGAHVVARLDESDVHELQQLS